MTLDTVRMTPAATRVLEVASELFYERGIRAVGVDLVADLAGVTKKTLYDRFGSKDRLVAAYLHRRDQRWREFLADYLDTHADPPGDARARLLAVFGALDVWRDLHGRRGCAFVNASAELPDADHPARRVIAGQKVWLRDLLDQLATQVGAADPRGLADQLLLLHEGAVVAQSVAELADAGKVARRAALTLLGGEIGVVTGVTSESDPR